MKTNLISSLACPIANQSADYGIGYFATPAANQLASQPIGKLSHKSAYPHAVSETETVPEPAPSNTLTLTEDPYDFVGSKFIFLQCKKPFPHAPPCGERRMLPMVAVRKLGEVCQ